MISPHEMEKKHFFMSVINISKLYININKITGSSFLSRNYGLQLLNFKFKFCFGFFNFNYIDLSFKF